MIISSLPVEVQTPKTCKENVDSRGLTWKETISGHIRDELCHSGFTGISYTFFISL
jgi:hypothetical protein